ncbi:MAG: FHA domain-containing protein, partial [Anaerolineae bacterium]
MTKLIIQSGPQAGIEFPMDRPVIRIGRGSGNDIVLQDSQSSRQHAEISQQGDQYFIRDLGSTNGTFVNDQQVTGPRLLGPGDRLRVGETELSFQPTPAAAPAAVDDWESQLWEERTEARPAGRPKWLVWGLVGAVVALIAIVAIVAVLLAG